MSVDRDIVSLDPYIDTGGFIIMLLPVRGFDLCCDGCDGWSFVCLLVLLFGLLEFAPRRVSTTILTCMLMDKVVFFLVSSWWRRF